MPTENSLYLPEHSVEGFDAPKAGFEHNFCDRIIRSSLEKGCLFTDNCLDIFRMSFRWLP